MWKVAKIGIPRALFYYHYQSFINKFLPQIEIDTIISPRTNFSIYQAGYKVSCNEICFPLRIFMGHILWLAERTDRIFVPRIVGFPGGCYACPKFMALPDLVRNFCGDKLNLIEPIFEFQSYPEDKARLAIEKFSCNLASELGLNKKDIIKKVFNTVSAAGNDKVSSDGVFSKESMNIGVIAHPYVISEALVSERISGYLKQLKINIITSHTIRIDKQEYLSDTSWYYGREILAAGKSFIDDERTAGLIYIVVLGCGVDSVVYQLINQYADYGNKKPVMMLVLDGLEEPVNIITRLEAFVETLAK